MEREYKLIIEGNNRLAFDKMIEGYEALRFSKEKIERHLNYIKLIGNVELTFTKEEIKGNEILTKLFKDTTERYLKLENIIDIRWLDWIRIGKNINKYTPVIMSKKDNIIIFNKIVNRIHNLLVEKDIILTKFNNTIYYKGKLNYGNDIPLLVKKEDREIIFDRNFYKYKLVLTSKENWLFNKTLRNKDLKEFIEENHLKYNKSELNISNDVILYFTEKEVNNNKELKKIFNMTRTQLLVIPKDILNIEDVQWINKLGTIKTKDYTSKEKYKIIDKIKEQLLIAINKKQIKYYIDSKKKMVYIESYEKLSKLLGKDLYYLLNTKENNKELSEIIKDNIEDIIEKIKKEKNKYYIPKYIMWVLAAKDSSKDKFIYLKDDINNGYDSIGLYYDKRIYAVSVCLIAKWIDIDKKTILKDIFNNQYITKDNIRQI